jgi:hypothetical protein
MPNQYTLAAFLQGKFPEDLTQVEAPEPAKVAPAVESNGRRRLVTRAQRNLRRHRKAVARKQKAQNNG